MAIVGVPIDIVAGEDTFDRAHLVAVVECPDFDACSSLLFGSSEVSGDFTAAYRAARRPVTVLDATWVDEPLGAPPTETLLALTAAPPTPVALETDDAPKHPSSSLALRP